jgi:hypothetical protein
MLAQVCAEEQGQGVIDNPPIRPMGLPTSTGVRGKFVTKPYCRAIALSEPILGVDGDGYWTQVASPDIVRRLVHLLGATDSETRLGSGMVLTKFCERTSGLVGRLVEGGGGVGVSVCVCVDVCL